MKKGISFALALIVLLGLLPAALSVNAAEPKAASWDNDGDGVLSILAIGNSFSDDVMEYVYEIAGSLGVEKIYVGRLYIGSCTLEMHRNNAEGNKGAYTYYYKTNDPAIGDTAGAWKKVSGKSMLYGLNRHSWDFVTLQQQSGRSGLPETYNEDLDYVINYVKTHKNTPKAKLAWHMTWAYQQDTTKADFSNYNKDQMTMYNAIVSTVRSKIVPNSDFKYIIPSGTAVQNARTSVIGDALTRDGYHMSKPYGRYLIGLMLVKTLTGLDISNVKYTADGVSDVYKEIAIESVNNAAAKPFQVTKSTKTSAIPKGYIQLKTPMYKGAFWHPQKSGRYNELITDQSNSSRFFTTIRFTKTELPVGSIILLNDKNYKYRPDGWKTDTLQSGTRESETSANYVSVTEAWWGSYTLRSFNVSRKDDAVVTGLTEEQMRSIFQIYVPESAHKHTFSNGACTLCGAASSSGQTTTKKVTTATQKGATTTKPTQVTPGSSATTAASVKPGTTAVSGGVTQAGATNPAATTDEQVDTEPTDMTEIPDVTGEDIPEVTEPNAETMGTTVNNGSKSPKGNPWVWLLLGLGGMAAVGVLIAVLAVLVVYMKK